MTSERNERRGSSGALIDVGPDRVSKFDTLKTGGRVREQGRWLYAYPFPQVPEVTRILPNGYEMEVLQPIDIFDGDALTWVKTAFDVWEKTQYPKGRITYPFAEHMFVDFSRSALRRYIIQLCTQLGQGSLGLSLLSVAEDFRPPVNAPVGLQWTHGDPIVDNLMMRVVGDESQYVLIDPIPPTPALPSHPMVDWGRFVQSAAGYEQIRYLTTFPEDYVWQNNVTNVVNRFSRRNGVFDNRAATAGLLYGIIGLLRGARTAPPDAKVMIIIQAQALRDELNVWMR